MQFILMDLIGPFDPSSNEHHDGLTSDMYVNRVYICVPSKTKAASEEVQAYTDEVYAKFRGSLKILSDNET